jgi:iron complex transport system ATP-binding protein
VSESIEKPGVFALETERISFSYNSTQVLHDINISIAPGEFVGIIGPNGSGKSTLLRILSGVLKPKSGVVRLDGTPIDELPRREVARRIAVVPQETIFTFAFSALEVVLMGRSPHLGRFSLEGPNDLSVARTSMEATDTWPLRDRSMEAVSGGEKQRVVISRALAQEPSILLLDEPTTALDIRHQVDIYRLLNRLHQDARHTVVLVQHDLNLAAKVCQRLVLLNRGTICRDGSPADVIRADLLSEVYETDLHVETDPNSGAPVVIVPL